MGKTISEAIFRQNKALIDSVLRKSGDDDVSSETKNPLSASQPTRGFLVEGRQSRRRVRAARFYSSASSQVRQPTLSVSALSM